MDRNNFKIRHVIAFGVIITMITSCRNMESRVHSVLRDKESSMTGEKGEGSKNSERKLASFSKIDVSGAITVEIECGNEQKVQVFADGEIIDKVRTEVVEKKLQIYTEYSSFTNHDIKVVISLPVIEQLELSGACEATVNNINSPEFRIDGSGSTNFVLSGIAKQFVVDVSGASEVKADNLQTETTKIDASGASEIEIAVSKELFIDASGASKVTYRGNPDKISQNISGACEVNKR